MLAPNWAYRPRHACVIRLCYGFSDPSGLVSIAFQDLGSHPGAGNYSFDNIVTAAAPVPVPEPATLSLLGLGLAGIGVRRVRRGAAR
jgi:hypothetical protein